MAAGFMLVKLGILKGEDSKVLSLLCIYVLLPCAILKSYQADYTPELRDGFMLAMGAAIAAQLILMAVTYGISGVCHLDATEKASIMYPNSANLILPLVAGVLGDHYMIYASAYSCVQGIFIWTHCTSMMKGSRDLNWKKVFLNINLITVAVGIIMFFGQIHLPQMALDTLGGFSAALGPISMIVIGMLFAGMNMKDIFANKRVYFISALRMIVIPLIALLLIKISHLTTLSSDAPKIMLIVFLAVITPSASTVTQMCQVYGNDAHYASAINVVTTLCAIVTMPLMVLLFSFI